MARPSPRTGTCTAAQARTRLQHAEAFVAAAELVLDDDTDPANAGVAASLAVLAGIAASDAACCAQLRKRHRGADHQQAPALLATVQPHGPTMAKDLRQLLTAKDDSHYGLTMIAHPKARQMLRTAHRITKHARTIIYG